MANNIYIQALSRGLRILNLAAASESGITQAQIRTTLGVTQSTAHNLAKTLLAHGFLERRRAPLRYTPGPAIDDLVARTAAQRWRKEAERVARNTFRRLSGATVILAEFHGQDLRVSLRMHPEHPEMLERYPALQLSPYSSAVGICCMAFAAPPEREMLGQRYPFTEYASKRWSDLADFQATLKQIRRQRIVVLPPPPQLRAAVPLYDNRGGLIGALGASFASAERPESENAQMLPTTLHDAANLFQQAMSTPEADFDTSQKRTTGDNEC